MPRLAHSSAALSSRPAPSWVCPPRTLCIVLQRTASHPLLCRLAGGRPAVCGWRSTSTCRRRRVHPHYRAERHSVLRHAGGHRPGAKSWQPDQVRCTFRLFSYQPWLACARGATGRPCRCHYRGKLASNNAVFDSSYERGRPLTFKACSEQFKPVAWLTC